MRSSKSFQFDTPDLDALRTRGYVYRVDATKIFDQDDVYVSFGKGLQAPNGYFGTNWDAFNDCLLDLHWIQQFNVFIVHDDLPKLSPADLAIYVDILCGCVERWGDKTITDTIISSWYVPHDLHVYFPRKLEKTIQYILHPDIPGSIRFST